MKDLKNLEMESEDEHLIEGNPEIIIPFDPNKIRIATYPFTIGQIMDRLENNEIQLNTEFQRLPNLWKNDQKSRLIESILLRLPIPNFYFDGDDDNNWQVVDGLQRIGSLMSFIENEMPLIGLQFLKNLEGLTYKQLPRDLQRRIQTFPISVNVIERGTPEQVKYHIFSRINQGGTPLTAQEIRHALHQGNGNGSELVEQLVRGEDWKDPQGLIKMKKATPEGIAFVKATHGTVKKDRMNDREYAARFVSFYLLGYTAYEPDLNSFLNKGMTQVKAIDTLKVKRLKSDFHNAMELSYAVFGDYAFRKQEYKDSSKSPINKALFEVISVSFAKLKVDDREKILKGKNKFATLFRGLFRKADGIFFDSVSTGTAIKEKVLIRHTEFQKMLQKFLHG